MASEELEIFRDTAKKGAEIGLVTMSSIAEACGELRLSRDGNSVHGYMVGRDIENDRGAL
ncbi:Hypothetical predicted protein, partial [Olea europaea subsp. europaea]